MSELSPLVSDLALILICAGVVTLLFKWLKQPLVLGYIVAGFLASPHMPYVPTVADAVDVHVWADIGVLFLLFALGLEFSFKKLLAAGSAAVIAACAVIGCMMTLGILVGRSFGWQQMDAIYLGGMLAMSSTTIIYKAFNDMGLLQQRFANMVLSVLILEDILAIVLMVVLSTMAVSRHFEGGALVASIGKLVFFLVLWFVVGLYLIPLLLRKVRHLMSAETLLVVALGLCFGMVVVAAQSGFSTAFGAFIMGSILAETIEAEQIEKLVAPVKDLFGAIFFVSVGMMVDPLMIISYALPIVAITLTILLGQTLLGSCGFLLAGQPLKVAMQCGFSLAQIGEFAFIIASLGVSLGVTSEFLYPIVVAVSVITTFLTPYVMRLSEPLYHRLEPLVPKAWQVIIHGSDRTKAAVEEELTWRKYLIEVVKVVVVYAILSIAVTLICAHIVAPIVEQMLPLSWSHWVCTLLTLACVAPFLRSVMMKKSFSTTFQTLWNQSKAFRVPLVAINLLRLVLGAAFVIYIVSHFFTLSWALLMGIAIVLVIGMLFSRRLKQHSVKLEQTFMDNLRSKELRDEFHGKRAPQYAHHLISHDLHLSYLDLPTFSQWAGLTLRELNFGQRYGVHIVSIIRGNERINIPGGDARLYPNDKIQVIGTDEEFARFAAAANSQVRQANTHSLESRSMCLKQFVVGSRCPFAGQTIVQSNIRNHHRCLVVGIENAEGQLYSPLPSDTIQVGDVIWIVGEQKDVFALLEMVAASENIATTTP